LSRRLYETALLSRKPERPQESRPGAVSFSMLRRRYSLLTEKGISFSLRVGAPGFAMPTSIPRLIAIPICDPEAPSPPGRGFFLLVALQSDRQTPSSCVILA